MLGQQILASLKARPNQIARELARELGAQRSQINALLYGELRGQVQQGRDYRWSLVNQDRQQTPEETGADELPHQNTPLARLARYYLACMGQEEVGVSTFAESRYGAPDYYELDTLPQSASELVCQDGFQRMAGKIRGENGRWAMYLGYPTSLKFLQSRRSSWQGFMVEPVFLFGIELRGANGEPVLDLTYPMINQKVLQNYTHAERDALMDELVQLERELGIGNPVNWLNWMNLPCVCSLFVRSGRGRSGLIRNSSALESTRTLPSRISTVRVCLTGQWSLWPSGHLLRWD